MIIRDCLPGLENRASIAEIDKKWRGFSGIYSTVYPLTTLMSISEKPEVTQL
jgi:hypothetical protein